MNARRSDATCVGQFPFLSVIMSRGYPTRVVVYVHAEDDGLWSLWAALAPSTAVWETRAPRPRVPLAGPDAGVAAQSVLSPIARFGRAAPRTGDYPAACSGLASTAAVSWTAGE